MTGFKTGNPTKDGNYKVLVKWNEGGNVDDDNDYSILSLQFINGMWWDFEDGGLTSDDGFSYDIIGWAEEKLFSKKVTEYRSVKLKPCPFCNGKPKLIVKKQRFFGFLDNRKKDILLGFYVRCNRCYARGGIITLRTNNRSDELGINSATKNWNTRTSE